MASMRDIRRRIRSVKNTQQITKAMKMVSAAKLKRAQTSVIAARPYADKLNEVLARLSQNTGDFVHPLQETREIKKVGLVLFTGDSGLCGGFNSSIIKECDNVLKTSDKEVSIIAIGRRGNDYFARRKKDIKETYIGVGDNPTYVQAKQISSKLIEMYMDGTLDEIRLVYNKFKSAMSQVPTDMVLLPIGKVEGKEEEKTIVATADYIYEPSEVDVLTTLLPAYVETLVYRALLESKASEHGARMTAMSSATDNADKIVDTLTLTLNRARQAAITTEISEIVSGAAAL